MSVDDHYLHLNRTSPIMPIEDIYNITRGKDKIGALNGYDVPTTPTYSPRSFKFPEERKKDMVYEISKRSKDPDPTAYSPKAEDMQKKFWNPPNGKFFKNRRKTFTEDMIQISSKLPGPGEYMPIPKGSVNSVPRSVLGKFDKEKDVSFMNDTLFHAEEIPGSAHYYSKLEDRDKAFAKIEKKIPVFKYYSTKEKTKEEKALVGPGYLKDLEDNFHKKSLSTSTPKYGIPKAKIVRKCEEIASKNKWVPGVGQYKEKDRAFTSFVLQHKHRMPFISKSKDVRFTEDYVKGKNWVPGPGSYNISLGPPIQRKK